MTSKIFTGQNPPQDDLQQASTKLSEMPIPVLHGPGSGAAPAGQPRPGDGQHAGRRQQGPGQRPVPRVRQGNQPHCLSWTLIMNVCVPGLPVEAAEPRGQGPRQDPEAGAPVVQVHGLHRHLRPVQAVREPRVHRAQRGRQEGGQKQTGKL